MNFKTTFFLFVALVGCAVAYLVFKPDPRAIREARLRKAEPADLDKGVEQSLIKDVKLGDIVKVACKLHKQPGDWVFEKTKVDDKDVWDIRQPLAARAASWQVDAIHRRIVELKYDVSYPLGEGGKSAQEAGLDPPQAVVTITDKDGKSATVEIGKSAGRNETYARLAGENRVVVAKSNFSTFFKDSALEYRDQKLFDFKEEEAVRLEVTDRAGEHEAEPVTYVLTRSAEGWVFESPLSGKATEEVRNAVTALANARVGKWKDNDPAKLPLYGLDKPAVSLSVTVEKKKEAQKPEDSDAAEEDQAADSEAGQDENAEDGSQEDKEAKAEPVIETFVHTLHISRISPLGEDTSLYVRVGDEAVVGTLPKTTTDKLKPVETRWRDMRVTSANTGKANRVQVTVGGRTADLVKKGEVWSFADSSQPADDDAVKDLLKAVSSLNAKAFVPIKAGDEVSMGLAAPEVVVKLTIPGQDEPERITVGGPSDGDVKRMYYVRRNDSTSAGKVRTEDLKNILRPITDFRSREVFSLGGGQFQRIELAYAHPLDDARVETAFERGTDGTWSMTRPVPSGVAADRFNKLVDALKTLKARRFVGDSDDLARYGLDNPAVTALMTYVASAAPSPAEDVSADSGDTEDKPRDKDRKEKKAGKGGPSSQEATGEDDQPPAEPSAEPPPVDQPAAPQTVQLLAGAVGADKFYLKRADAAAVYELDRDFFDKLRDEYHADKVLDFSDSQAVAFSIRQGQTTHAFEKRDGQWVLSAEPDLPLDQKAVGNLLVNLADLKTTRYIRYAGADAASYGLSEPDRKLTVTLDDQTMLELGVSEKACEKDAARRHYASRGSGDVFLLGSDMLGRIEVKLDTLEAKE